MKFTAERNALAAALSKVMPAISRRGPKPILTNVRIEANGVLKLSATNLEQAIEVETAAEISGDGVCLLSAESLSGVLKSYAGDTLVLESTDSGLSVTGDRAKWRFRTSDAKEYPVLKFEAGASVEVPGLALATAIKQTSFAASNEEARYALDGVLFELSGPTLSLVATDGKRIACRQIRTSSDLEVSGIVPLSTCKMLERSLGDDSAVALSILPNAISFASEGLRIHSRLVGGRFPRWRDVIPGKFPGETILVPVDQFRALVEQASVVRLLDERILLDGIEFTFAGGELKASMQGKESGESDCVMPIAYDGKPLNVSLRSSLLLDYLRCCGEETLNIHVAKESVNLFGSDRPHYGLMALAADR